MVAGRLATCGTDFAYASMFITYLLAGHVGLPVTVA